MLRTGAATGAALRAAVTTALWQARDDEYIRAQSRRGRTVLIDDLCRHAARLDELCVTDVDLARAAAEAGEAQARIVRILYGARLSLRAAGHEVLDAKVPALAAVTNRPAPERMQEVGDLRSALTTIHQAGLERAAAPRRLVGALSQCAQMSGAVARMLRAAHAGDPSVLVDVLSAPPYSLQAADVALALCEIEPLADVRETLAVAIGALPGGDARDTAVAALDALDAAVRIRDDAPSVAAGARAVEAAMREFACGRGEHFHDAQFTELLEAATHADTVWAFAQGRPPILACIASVIDGVAIAQTDDHVAIVADDGQESTARIMFEDDANVSLTWKILGTALGMPDAPEREVGLTVRVGSHLGASLTPYLESVAQLACASPKDYAWPGAEPPIAFTAPPMTFSASRLNAYVKCPRRWFFDYLCQVLADPSSLQAAYGSVVHDALESLHRAVRVPGRHDPGVMLERLLKELDIAFGNARDDFPSQLEYEVSRARARRIAEHYIRWLVSESTRMPMQVEHVELMQRLTLGGHEFVGYIDRIDRPTNGGPVTILDYKTGRVDTDAVAYLEKVRSGEEAQLALYYAMRTASGDDVKRIALVSVRDPRDEVWILALDIEDTERRPDAQREDGMLRAHCSRSDLEASLSALVTRCDTLTKSGQTHFAAGADPPCSYCAYREACRERPPRGERIFAR
jgi:RecB family exonuclease